MPGALWRSKVAFRKVGRDDASGLLLQVRLSYSHWQRDEALRQLLRKLRGNQRARGQNGAVMTTSAADVLARLQVARGRLHAADPVIAGLIDRRPDYDPRHRLDGIPPMDLFGALVFQVTGQQLSVSSRRRILDRIQEVFGGHLPSPAELLQAHPAGLRQAGLSGRKVSTLRDLAERLTDGRLNVDAPSALPDEQIIAELTQVPGIGPGPYRAP
jgi:3-methyladenine DNA glycosylase/8-oxoguanine DNA glycosylase